MGLLVLVPVLPKVKIITLAGMPLLLDDAVLNSALLLAVSSLALRASVTGSLRVVLSSIAIVFGCLILYKTLDLGILSLFYPWTDRWGIGRGVLVAEGVLVIGKTLSFFLIYSLFYNCLRDLDSITKILRWYLLTVAVVVTVGLVQFFALGHRSLTSTFRNAHVLKESFGFADPWSAPSAVGHEHLGAFMILSVSIIGGMLISQWPLKRSKRFFLGALWLGCMFSLVYASSRGAWIGGVCALGMFIWATKIKNKVARMLQIAVFVSCFFLLLNWLWDLRMMEYIEARTAGLDSVLSEKVKDDSARNRLRLLQGLWNTFLDSPVVGWGPGGAGRIAEGQLIRELVEGGLIGAGLFLGLMATVGWVALKAYGSSLNPMARGVSIGFVCGLVGLFGQAFFTELFILTKVGTPFWILAAIVHKLYRLEQQPAATT